jgi:hypothetical protein
MALSLKTVPASRGPTWLKDAFSLFARKPLGFLWLFVVFLLAAMAASLVPVLGSLVQFMALPLLSLGFMVAGQSALLGGPVHPRQYLEPLRTDATRRRTLAVLCVGYGLGAMLVLVLADQVSGHAWDRWQELAKQLAVAKTPAAQAPLQAKLAALFQEPGIWQGGLLLVVLGTALSVPFWHAPALVHWGGQSAGQALFSSTLALLRTKAAMFTYMMAWVVIIMVFGLASGVLFSMLGMPQLAGALALPVGLVFSTVFYLSALFCFNDSFGGAAADVSVPGDAPKGD